MHMLKGLQNARIRLYTWFRQMATAIRVVFRSKISSAARQEISSSMTQQGLGARKSNDNLTLESYLNTPEGQLQLAEAKVQVAEVMMVKLSEKYHQIEPKPTSAELMMYSLAIQQLVRQNQQDEKVILRSTKQSNDKKIS